MINRFQLGVLLFFFVGFQATAQSIDSLRATIRQLVSTRNALVGVSLSGNGGKDTLTLHGDRRFPLQSVFKLHIALAVLSEIDKGNFSLSQKITIRTGDLLPALYSPIRDIYPRGATLPLSKILTYTVSKSDNVGCDLLLRLIGGPQRVEEYFKRNRFTNLSIKLNEQTQQASWEGQFQNWTTPKEATGVLARFYTNKEALLSPGSHNFIWGIMKQTSTGMGRLKGQLPPSTVVAHKTGSSGTSQAGLMAAVNDIGIVFLPNGQFYYISVFVTDSTEDIATNEKIIADISKAAWDYFTAKAPQKSGASDR